MKLIQKLKFSDSMMRVFLADFRTVRLRESFAVVCEKGISDSESSIQRNEFGTELEFRQGAHRKSSARQPPAWTTPLNDPDYVNVGRE